MERFAVRLPPRLLKALSHPARLHILMVLANEEACVCHIQAVVRLRQAAVSQHLMELRRAGLIAARREGSHIYYHLNDPRLLVVLEDLRALALVQNRRTRAAPKLRLQPLRGRCPCPRCSKPEH